jgi:tetratricopeptide (TPR) repeat protein
VKPKIFISFAGPDEDARILLGAELKRQGIDTYDYSFPHAGSEVGMKLSEQLAQKIVEADLVIALATNISSAPDRHVIHAEIQQALDAGFMQRDRLLVVLLRTEAGDPPVLRFPKDYACLSESRLRDIAASYPDHVRWSQVGSYKRLDSTRVHIRTGVPVPGGEIALTAHTYHGYLYFPMSEWERLVNANAPILEFLRTEVTKRWLGPFSELQKHVCTHVDQIAPRNFAAVGQLVCERLGCERLGLRYERPSPEDSRLPFYQQLQDELWDLPTHVRVQVLGHTDCFQSKITVGSWRTVLNQIRALQSILLQWERDPYYPRIIEGVCLARLGENDKSLAVFDHCLSHPKTDENALGGRAKALHKLGRHAEALAALREAIECCDRKGDPAPVARLDRLTLALESWEHGGEPGPEYARECILAFEDADTLLLRDFGKLGLEERIKVAKLRARWLHARARMAENEAAKNLRAEALRAFDEIVHSVHAEVDIPPASMSGVPAGLENAFYVALADIGFFLDEPEAADTGGRVRLHGKPGDFWLVERDQAYRFTEGADGRHAVHYVDLQIVQERHQLRLELGHERSGLMGELDQALTLFPTLHLIRFVMREWCELDNLDRAWDIGQDALATYGEDALVLQDLAEIADVRGHDAEARRLMAASAEAARQAILSPQKTEWSRQDLFLAWGRARAFEDEMGDVLAAARLSGLPLEDFRFHPS